MGPNAGSGAVLADACFCNLSRAQFTDALRWIRGPVVAGGLLAITLEEGDSESWTRPG